MTVDLITDPWFYAAAIPAVLLLGISKSGFGVGFGSLAVPMMALVIPVPQAAAITLPLLLAIDVLGVRVFKADFDRKLLLFMLPFGLLGIVLGALLFKLVSIHVVSGIVGALTLIFLAQRLLFPPRTDSVPPPRWLGAILVCVSGFTSFIAHAGGPPINAYALPLKLKPIVFTATLAYFFFVINLAKWLPFALLGLLDTRNFQTSVALLPLAPIGVYVGRALALRISVSGFYRIVYWGMFLSGVKLLWDAY